MAVTVEHLWLLHSDYKLTYKFHVLVILFKVENYGGVGLFTRKQK